MRVPVSTRERNLVSRIHSQEGFSEEAADSAYVFLEKLNHTRVGLSKSIHLSRLRFFSQAEQEDETDQLWVERGTNVLPTLEVF